MKRRIAIIEWTDSAIHGNDECSVDDKELTPQKITSVGIVVKDMAKYITIAMDDTRDGKYRTLETIVRSGITNIEYIKR